MIERVNAVLRRTNGRKDPRLVLSIGGLTIDLINQEVELLGNSIPLTHKDFRCYRRGEKRAAIGAVREDLAPGVGRDLFIDVESAPNI